MAKKNGGGKGKAIEKAQAPRSLVIAARGVKTGDDFAGLMSALMSDLIEGRVTPQIGNATCNAGGKLLKVVELQYKYATNSKEPRPRRKLILAFEDHVIEDGAVPAT